MLCGVAAVVRTLVASTDVGAVVGLRTLCCVQICMMDGWMDGWTLNEVEVERSFILWLELLFLLLLLLTSSFKLLRKA